MYQNQAAGDLLSTLIILMAFPYREVVMCHEISERTLVKHTQRESQK